MMVSYRKTDFKFDLGIFWGFGEGQPDTGYYEERKAADEEANVVTSPAEL